MSMLNDHINEITEKCYSIIKDINLFHDYVRIQTKFVYSDGHFIDIYIKEENSALIFTDLGTTISNIRDFQMPANVDLFSSFKYKPLIEDIKNSYKIKINNNHIQIDIVLNEAADNLIQIIQACIRFFDLAYFTNNVRNTT